ncbi:MAG TPA: hypothetical protein VF599_20070 [Pyrinomonadaceae bacterium]|jgi:NMD protein affecting ribosome stability and mRNA decay
MKKMLLLTLAVFLFSGCRSASTPTAESSAPTGAGGSSAVKPEELAVGDNIIYLSKSAQRLYEAKVTSINGTRVQLNRDNETVESDVADIYRIPKSVDKNTLKAGDVIAVKYGQLAVWETAEVVDAGGDKIAVKWLSTDRNAEIPPDNILTLPSAAQARIKKAFDN